MESSVFWLRVAACLYAVGLLHSILVLVRHGQSVFSVARVTFRIAVVLHGVAIVPSTTPMAAHTPQYMQARIEIAVAGKRIDTPLSISKCTAMALKNAKTANVTTICAPRRSAARA